jgi:hypothetical protein
MIVAVCTFWQDNWIEWDLMGMGIVIICLFYYDKSRDPEETTPRLIEL